MNYLDLFKVLEKTNCGKCGMATCIAFALSVSKGDKSATDCPFLEWNIAARFTKEIARTDWKQDLIGSLKKETSGINFGEIAEGLGAEYRKGRLRLQCLGSNYFIDESGAVHTEGHLNPWIEILLLHYVRSSGKLPLSGKWISFSELKGGLIKISSFTRECEEPLRRIIDEGTDEFNLKIGRLGGKAVSEKSSDNSWIIRPLPKVPFLLLYWKSGGEFDSAVKVLFDSSTGSYLDVESLIFLGEGIVKTLKRIPAASMSRK